MQRNTAITNNNHTLEDIMATQILNTFSQFTLTVEEQAAGELLSATQVQVIRNLLAGEALKRIALIFDPLQPMHFAQQEAEIQGAIGAYSYLLEAHEIAKEQLVPVPDTFILSDSTDFIINSEESVTQNIFS